MLMSFIVFVLSLLFLFHSYQISRLLQCQLRDRQRIRDLENNIDHVRRTRAPDSWLKPHVPEWDEDDVF